MTPLDIQRLVPPPGRMPLVYVAGKFTAPTRDGVEENIAKAEQVAIEVARIGGMPVCPHTNTAHPHFEHVQPYQFWIEGTLALLRRCDALILVEGWEESRGTCGEIDEANRLGIPVFAPGALKPLAAWVRSLRENAP